MEMQQPRGTAFAAPNAGSLIPEIDPAVAMLSNRARSQLERLPDMLAANKPEPTPQMAEAMRGWQNGQPPPPSESGRQGSAGYADQSGIVEGLVQRGIPQHIAEGFAMNGVDESGLNPSAIGDNGNAGGIWQMNGPRFKGLKDFAASNGQPWDNRDTQLDHLVYEINNNERGAWSKISATTTRQEAAAAIVNYFERPAEVHRARREAAYLASR